MVMSTLTLTISGIAVPIKESSLKISNKIDQRSTCTFSVIDSAGTYNFTKGQPVMVTDSVFGVLFSGYVNDPKANNLLPTATIQWDIDCVEQMWLTDKRSSNIVYGNQQAAVILCDQLQNILAVEGVNGQYSLDYNHYLTDWASGAAQLTNVVASTSNGDGNAGDGDLEIARSGVTLSYTDDLTKGTFTSTQVVNGGLCLASTQGLQLMGTCAQASSSGTPVNAYAYYKIWSGSGGYTIQSGDQLQYDVWVASTSPVQSAGVDFACSDGTTLRDTPGIYDQNGIAPHPSNDLSGFATDQWYSRVIDISSLSGKSITYVSLGLEGDSSGIYTSYFRKIKITSGSNTKLTIFSSTLNTKQVISTSFYINVSLIQSTVYEMSGSRQAPAISLNMLGIPQASEIAWVAPAPVSSLAPTVPSTSSTLPVIAVETSFDGGATWQGCTNYSAIPALIAGMSLKGKNLLIQQILLLVGTDPTITPVITGCIASITPAYNATKSDVVYSANTQALWNAGTKSNVQSNANGTLTLVQASRDWHYVSQLQLSDQTQFSNGGVPSTQTQFGYLQLSCNGSSNDCRSRMDFAGNAWNNFTVELDINLGTPVPGLAYGIEYRTTYWGPALNSSGWYYYFIFTTGVLGTLCLGYGTNNSAGGGLTNVYTSAPITLTSGSMHRLKVIVNGSSHQLFLDEILYTTVTNGTYSGSSGYVAAHFFNNSSVRHSGDFGHFGICNNLTGTWTSPSISLTAAGTYQNSVIQWNDVEDASGASSLAVLSSIDGGTTYYPCSNGAPVPKLVAGQSLTGVNLKVQARLTTTDATATPTLHGLTAWVIGGFSASGVWQNTPLFNDTMVRSNVVGSFGTSFDGQSYAKVGTGTVALTGNEAIISATTGDVEMVGGTNTSGDQDGSVRFSLSTATMEAGIELRRVDGNNFYRLYATGTTLVIVENIAGVLSTLASVAVTIPPNTYYRMRFRVVGSGPTASFGRVWLDGTTEPSSWNVTASV